MFKELHKAKKATAERFWYYASLNPWYFPEAPAKANAENYRLKILDTMTNSTILLEKYIKSEL